MRSEAKTMQVHPNDEQYYIDLMQEFHWNLKSSQEVKTKDSHLETRAGELYNVTETEHYCKLLFERPYAFPNRDEIVKLENEFFGMNYPMKGEYKSVVWTTLIIAAIVYFAVNGIVALLILAAGGYWLYSISQGNTKKQQQWAANNIRRKAIISEARSLVTYA